MIFFGTLNGARISRAMSDQTRFVRLEARLQHDDRRHRLDPFRIGQADDRDFGHRRDA